MAILRQPNEEEEKESQAVLEKCQGKPGCVSNLKQTPVKENPTALYDLTTLQREANKTIGLSAQQTLDTAQSLYEKKLITYPRTDSRYLTKDMTQSTKAIIANLLKASFINPNTKSNYNLNLIDLKRVINDKKVTDHHAILPTAQAYQVTQSSLTANEFDILLMITYKLLMAVYLAHEYIKTDIVINIEGEEFKASGRQIVVGGYKILQNHLSELIKTNHPNKELKSKKNNKKAKDKQSEDKDTLAEKEDKEEAVLPQLAEEQVLDTLSLTAKEKQSQPPKPYTDNTLLSAMENAMKTLEDEELRKEVSGAGLGTPATRAGIIERIIKSKYIERKGKSLLPTPKAYELVDVIPEKVKSAILTAEWEQKLEQIYKGEMNDNQFILGIENYVTDLVNEYKNKLDENGKEIIGKCPRCGKNIYEGKVNYYCQSGKDCNFVIWKNDSFFEKKRKTLTKAMVQAFLEKGYIKAGGLYSEKKDKTYIAYIILEDTGKYVNFKLHFPKK